MNHNTRIHPLDKLISDESLFLLEAMVPFVEFPLKKVLVMFIKYKELMCILETLNDKDYIASCGFDCHPSNMEEMVSHMFDFLPGNMASSIQQMKQMMNVMEMMGTTNTPKNTSPDNNSLYESILSILEEGK